MVVLVVASALPSLAQSPRVWQKVTVPGMRAMLVPRGGRLERRQPEARADRVLVTLQPGYAVPASASAATRAQAKASLAARLGAEIDRYWPALGMASVKVDPSKLAETIAALRGKPGVRTAGYDLMVYPAYVPDTPEFEKQWHQMVIDAPDAWDAKPQTDWRRVVIADVDTGVWFAHPDLKNQIWTNTGEIPGNGIDDDHNGYIDDVHGWNFVDNNNDPEPTPTGQDLDGDGIPDENCNHGTLTAGLAGASVFDDWGCAGVYPNAAIMSVKVFPSDGGTDIQTVVDGINYAINNGAEIINLSIGSAWSDAFSAPIEAAHARGIVVVAAAGNDAMALTDTYWESPVCNDGPNPLQDNYVIGVAYTDSQDTRGTYSNWDDSTGKHFVDACAPGDAIYGPALYDPQFGFNSYFQVNTGTSFACPMVSGAAALIKAVFPSLGVDDIIQRIRTTGDNIDKFNGIYAGKLGLRLYLPRAVGMNLPPRPVKNLTAADTPGDHGGSITLSWVLSFDDGSGSMKVTNYTILRRAGTTGDFTQVGEVAKGTDDYVDNTTTDGTDYYYKVGATDGTLTGYCDPVGPATSVDDEPPPQVTTLVGKDHPGDEGGAIDLAWTGYTPPSDCGGYHVYRDTTSFSSIGDRTPIATITKVDTTTYTDSPTVDFTDYYYAVVAFNKEGYQNDVVTPAGPVQSMPNTKLPLPAGLSLMSAPAVPYDFDPATLLGSGRSFKYAAWDLANSRYVIYSPGGSLTDVTRMALAKGFWVWLPSTVQITIDGETASSGNMSLDLQPGWQLLGNPYFGSLDLGQAQVTVGGLVMNLRAAEEDGYLSSSVYVFDSSSQSYQMESALWTGQAIVPTWSGFWMDVYKPCTLTLVRPTSTSSTTTAAQVTAAAAGGVRTAAVMAAQATSSAATATSTASDTTTAKPAAKLDWCLRLSAEGNAAADVDNFVAASSAPPTPAPKPPPAPGAPRLYISENGKQYAAVAQQPATNMTWQIVVQPAAGEDRTWVSAEQVVGLPSDYGIILRNPASGSAIDLRRQARVEVVGTQQLEVEVTRESGASLVVTTMGVQPTAAGGQVVFALSAPATVDLQVMNIAGRLVRTLKSGQLTPAGQQVVVWDGRNNTASLVPQGLYLVRLRAQAADGTQVQALRTLRLQR